MCALQLNNIQKKILVLEYQCFVLDVDNYEGTLECLKNLYPNVTRGGLIVLDEYALEKYGEIWRSRRVY